MPKFMNFNSVARNAFNNDEAQFASFSKLLVDAA